MVLSVVDGCPQEQLVTFLWLRWLFIAFILGFSDAKRDTLFFKEVEQTLDIQCVESALSCANIYIVVARAVLGRVTVIVSSLTLNFGGMRSVAGGVIDVMMVVKLLWLLLRASG